MSIAEEVGMATPARKWGTSPALVLNDVFIGVEVELENVRLTDRHRRQLVKGGLWRIHEDGSLRDNGREFIMQETATGQPLMGADITRALDTFKGYIDMAKDDNKLPKATPRTSLHVHMDVRDLEKEEFARFILLYYAFEDILFKWVGEDRHLSNFCRPASSNYDIITRAANLLGGVHPFRHLIEDGNKYDALNYQVVRQLGSVEIRSMHGTYDTDLILRWINILMRLREACKDTNIQLDQFPEQASREGMQALLSSVFKEQAAELLPLVDEIDILRGVRVAQEILVLSEEGDNHLSSTYDTGAPMDGNINKFKQQVLGA